MLNPGLLTCTKEVSESGHFVQALTEQSEYHLKEKDNYWDVGGKYRSSIEWTFEKVKNLKDTYIIRNRSISPGILTFSSEASSSGRFVQILDENNKDYQNDKHEYEPDGKFYKFILWQVIPTDVGWGCYRIENVEKGTPLTYTDRSSFGGNFLQVLEKGNPNYEKEKHEYLAMGEYEYSVKFKLTNAYYKN